MFGFSQRNFNNKFICFSFASKTKDVGPVGGVYGGVMVILMGFEVFSQWLYRNLSLKMSWSFSQIKHKLALDCFGCWV